MAMNELMTFRTAYLRAIALAWVDDGFKGELFRDATGAMKRYLDFDWPWPEVCELVVKDEPQFQWICNEWVWPRYLADYLTLYAPLDPYTVTPGETAQEAPREIPDPLRALALADYYRQRSSLFSDSWGGALDSSGPRGGPSLAAKGLGSFNPVIGGDSPAPAGGFYPADDEFAAFEVALLEAIARAWHDKPFKELLKIDAAAALQTVRGYELPWKVTIRIHEDRQARWHPPAIDGQGQDAPLRSYWSFGQKNVLRLNLPSKPSELQSEPVALAMYNATGAAYPFTCTC